MTIFKKNLISIIVPCYNSEKYIERTLESVLNQKYTNFEIIVVDDCSNDNSILICERFCNKYNNIKIVRHDSNKGQTITRDDGISLVTGEWMMFLDSDDVIGDNVLTNYISIIRDYNPDIIISGYEKIMQDGTVSKYYPRLNDGIYSSTEFGKYLFSDIGINVLTCVGSKLYKTDFIKNKKIKTSNDIKTNWDMAFVIDALISCNNVYCLNKIGYTYLIRNGSITYSYRENMYENIVKARSRIKDYFFKCNCYNEKKIDLELFQYSLIRKTLQQEITFKKGYKSFKNALHSISVNSRTKETADIIIKANVKTKFKFFMQCIMNNNCLLLYIICLIVSIRR